MFSSRDIKPENLLITEEGRIKLCDLGFTRMSDKTNYMTIAGSDDYMAPEVLCGEKYDEKCDVFGFGVVLGVILARKSLPQRDSTTFFQFKRPRLAQFLPSDCPEPLKQLVLDCCENYAVDRPTFSSVIERLSNYLTETPMAPPPPEESSDSSITLQDTESTSYSFGESSEVESPAEVRLTTGTSPRTAPPLPSPKAEKSVAPEVHTAPAVTTTLPSETAPPEIPGAPKPTGAGKKSKKDKMEAARARYMEIYGVDPSGQ